MLGGGAANWTGTIDKTPTSIGKYEGAQAKYMIGLRSEPIQDDKDAATAAASLFITGNSSNIHGGGIMTNGDVVAGDTTQVSVYPKMKLNGTKALTGRALDAGEFKFQLLKQNKIGQVPSFDIDGKLQLNGCSKIGDGVTNNADGSFAFDLGRVYSDGPVVYYLVEDPGDKPVSGVTYDKTIYKIEFETTVAQTQEVLDITYTYYSVDKVKVTNLKKNESNTIIPSVGSDVSIEITEGKTFTNAYTPKGSWIPKATKVVEGGEMKAFTLEFADNEEFKNAQEVKTQANGGNSQTLNLVEKISYKLDDLTKGADSTGRGASKTFFYYVHEKDEHSTYPHYKFDPSVYRFKVVATDKAEGNIDCAVTYRKGTVNSEGTWVDADTKDHEFADDSTPTFTNTYSTSLPLSGMSGVTLTYLAGAAVLCAAAAWMHIRRKANAKGGERRE